MLGWKLLEGVSKCVPLMSPHEYLAQYWVHGTLENTFWVNECHWVLQQILLHACMLSCFSSIQLLATQRTLAPQASLSIGFSSQEHWSGLPFSSRGSSRPRDWTHISYLSCMSGGFFTPSTTWEVFNKYSWSNSNSFSLSPFCPSFSCLLSFYLSESSYSVHTCTYSTENQE